MKHVEGTKKFEEYAKSRLEEGKGYQSRITISKEEVQQLIYSYAGTGKLCADDGAAAGSVVYVEM